MAMPGCICLFLEKDPCLGLLDMNGEREELRSGVLATYGGGGGAGGNPIPESARLRVLGEW